MLCLRRHPKEVDEGKVNVSLVKLIISSRSRNVIISRPRSEAGREDEQLVERRHQQTPADTSRATNLNTANTGAPHLPLHTPAHIVSLLTLR